MCTSDALILATETIRREIDENKIVADACLDLSKTFDSISPEILLQKLEELSLDNHSNSMIRSFLTSRTQKVCLETVCSNWIFLYHGVPQGTILGPLLFFIHINSMHLHVTEPVKILQYADDTFLFAANEDIEVGIIQLERVKQDPLLFFQKHQLNMKANETEFIIFSKKSQNQDKSYELIVSNHQTSHTKTINYLGILLSDESLTYQVEVKNILKKMACGIKTLYSIEDLFPEKIRLSLFNALVVSHLQYSSVLLNGHFSIEQNLKTTLEKQLNWGNKSNFPQKQVCVFRRSKNRTQNFMGIILVRLENELLLLEMEKSLSSCLYWQ